MVAFRDCGRSSSHGSPHVRQPTGDLVIDVTGYKQLPFGRDENQAKTYDDWSVQLSSSTTRGKQPPNAEGEATGVASGRQRYSIISDGLPTQLPDIDPDETREWVDSFDSVTRTRGRGFSRNV